MSISKAMSSDDAWRSTLRGVSGRKVLDEIMTDLCGMDSPIPAGDPISMAMEAGKRNIALMIKNRIIGIDRESYCVIERYRGAGASKHISEETDDVD